MLITRKKRRWMGVGDAKRRGKDLLLGRRTSRALKKGGYREGVRGETTASRKEKRST